MISLASFRSSACSAYIIFNLRFSSSSSFTVFVLPQYRGDLLWCESFLFHFNSLKLILICLLLNCPVFGGAYKVNGSPVLFRWQGSNLPPPVISENKSPIFLQVLYQLMSYTGDNHSVEYERYENSFIFFIKKYFVFTR